MNSDRNGDGIELADLISQVRSDLTAAMLSGQLPENQDLLKFELGDVELELELVVEKAHKPGVKARLLVVDVGYDHERIRKSTNRIKLKMQPRLPSQPIKGVVISGQAEEGEE
jgi:hypothetical protein